MYKIEKSERRRLPDGRSLTVEKHTVVGGHPLHWHSYFEIEIILSGSGKYIINDIEYDISVNDAFFLNPTDFHYLDVDDVTELINVSFDNDILDDKDIALLAAETYKRAYMLNAADRDRLLSAADILLNEYEISGDCQKQILQYIVKFLLRKNTVPIKEISDCGHNNGIKKAIRYLEAHFMEKLSLDEVAAAAGYHPTYFSQLFSAVTGETYIDMLTRLRLGHAKSMLANGFSVSDSCFQSGFGSLSNFLEIFKRKCKTTPNEYRKKALKTR
jgi:AraC-like DNA-binding protein